MGFHFDFPANLFHFCESVWRFLGCAKMLHYVNCFAYEWFIRLYVALIASV